MSELKKRKLLGAEPSAPVGKKPKAGGIKQEININDSGVDWVPEEVIAEEIGEQSILVGKVVEMLEIDHTVPFIARYRKEQTRNMEPEKIRHIQQEFVRLKEVKKKVESTMVVIKKEGKLTRELETVLRTVKSKPELEYLTASIKPSSKRTLAERAKEMGLEEAAVKLMEGKSVVNIASLVCNTEGKKTQEQVETGLQHIIADKVAKHPQTVTLLRSMCKRLPAFTLECKKSRSAGETKDKKKNGKVTEVKVNNFENYFNFSNSCNRVKSHQVLAINRGESLKVLTVRVNVEPRLKDEMNKLWKKLWMTKEFQDPLRESLLSRSFTDAYNRLVMPMMQRQVRAELGRVAEKESINVFSRNLKNLLLAPPLRGSCIIAIDPGYKHGCKVAVIGGNSEVLHTGVIYLNDPKTCNYKLASLIRKYGADTLALGNGTACREMEAIISKLLSESKFENIDPRYVIVDEQGASIYSCSTLAKKEFPDLDPNLISAVSLGRRLQDPMSELVKIDPQHLGVGMYQHDVSQTQLKATLESVVSECVSFVGVDLNVVSDTMLTKIAGLTTSRSAAIIKWREENGGFKSRAQLQLVKGIGPKTYQQMAGFVRILPQTMPQKVKSGDKSSKKKHKIDEDINPLDRTCIHPETYSVANKLLADIKADPQNIGYQSVIQAVRSFVKASSDPHKVAEEYGVGEATWNLIIEGLSQSLDYDLRNEFHKPLFRRSMISLKQLKVGSMLTGRVTNVTNFGAFVDIGVEKNGLIYGNGKEMSVSLGDRVKVKVNSVDASRERIGLQLISTL